MRSLSRRQDVPRPAKRTSGPLSGGGARTARAVGGAPPPPRPPARPHSPHARRAPWERAPRRVVVAIRRHSRQRHYHCQRTRRAETGNDPRPQGTRSRGTGARVPAPDLLERCSLRGLVPRRGKRGRAGPGAMGCPPGHRGLAREVADAEGGQEAGRELGAVSGGGGIAPARRGIAPVRRGIAPVRRAFTHHTPKRSGSHSRPSSEGGAMYPTSAEEATTAGLAR